MPIPNLCSGARSVARQRRRIAIATAGLATFALVLVPGARRALAKPSADRGGAAVRRVAPRAAPESTTSTTRVPPPAPVVAGQEAVVEIPSLKVSLPVVRGGQRVIDEGVAAHYSETGQRPVVAPGQPGTYWLAAHDSTHGAPFAPLPAIADGADVRIKTLSGVTATYTVTSREVVGSTTTEEAVYGPDTTTPRILLQTCQGDQRLLVHGVLTSETPASDDSTKP